MVNEKIKITYKTLANKSRQGLYAYVKQNKKAGRYYKVKPEVGRDDEAFKKVYLSGGIKSRKGVTKETIKGYTKGLKLIKKYPHIEDSLRSGYAQTTVENAHKITPYGMKTAYMRLLMNTDKKGDGKSVVRDQQLIQILTMPENVEKWKRRIMYKIDLINNNNEVMGTIIPTRIKNMFDIRKEILSQIKLGEEYGAFSKALRESVLRHGYALQTAGNINGRIAGIRLTLVFKKQ